MSAQHTPTPMVAELAMHPNGMHEIRTGATNERERHLVGYAVSYEQATRIVRACNAHDELVAKADAVARTLEMPTLVRQSTKNENAGFIDWRDWCALKGEVAALRAALAKAVAP